MADELVRILTPYQFTSRLYLVPFDAVQRQIVAGAHESYRVLLYRRMMGRISRNIAWAERAHGLPRYPDFAFPQLSSPELAPPDWRPRFIDYLYIGFTTANAFSPTDTMPLTPWAKVAMATQALISFVIVGLVIARAVNVFT